MTVVVTQLPFVVAQFVWRSLVVGAPHFGTFAGEFMAKQPQNTHTHVHHTVMCIFALRRL